MDRVLEHLFVQVDKAYREGANILILSDRGVDENHVAIPSLLAVSAVHKHLVKTKKCTALSIILESGEPREVHRFCDAARLRCVRGQPVSGPCHHRRADRRRSAEQGLLCGSRRL